MAGPDRALDSDPEAAVYALTMKENELCTKGERIALHQAIQTDPLRKVMRRDHLNGKDDRTRNLHLSSRDQPATGG